MLLVHLKLMTINSWTKKTVPFESHHSFNMIVQNVLSINNKIQILESFLQDYKYEAICLYEIWISETKQKIHTSERIPICCRLLQKQTKRRRRRSNLGARWNGVREQIRYFKPIYSIEYIIEWCAIGLKPNFILTYIYRDDRDIEHFFAFIKQLNKI